MRYVLDFGSANAGGAPAFTLFANLESGAALPAPEITEIGSGLYAFEYTPAVATVYKATLNGAELSDVLAAPLTALTIQTGTGAATAAGRFSTAAEIINRAAAEVGLAPVEDPFSSLDPNFIQLRYLLQSAGDELLRARQWSHLTRECGFVTENGQSAYRLPDDFHAMLDQTGWNRTTRFPLEGPLSPQQWQYFLGQSGVTLNVIFRLTSLEMWLLPAPPAGLNITFEYLSKYWVQTGTGQAPDAVAPVAPGDFVLFDPLLAVRALKAKFLQAKGFDSTVAVAEYERALENAAGRDGGAPVLSISHRRGSHRYLDNANLPITGYGA